MKGITYFISALLVIVTLIGCNSTPDYVIPPEKMAQLLADLHTGESVAEINRSEYSNDSLKKMLKQSIYTKHSVTAQQIDTSFVWYGHHIEEYIKVYDRVIAILDKELKNVGTYGNDAQITVAGDSADVWNGVRCCILSNNAPSEYISFYLNKDDNWNKGDNYQWQMKLFNNRSVMEWSLFADYDDGTTDYYGESKTVDGWNRLSFVVDSTKNATRLYGVARISLAPGERVFVDSVSLIRTRLNPKQYTRFNYKTFKGLDD